MEYIGNLWSPCSLHEQAKGGFIIFGHAKAINYVCMSLWFY